jgi:hypothetical protein
MLDSYYTLRVSRKQQSSSRSNNEEEQIADDEAFGRNYQSAAP